jgi:hypothetical protein
MVVSDCKEFVLDRFPMLFTTQTSVSFCSDLPTMAGDGHGITG